jgi:UMF1 family MFS transporter
MPSADDHAAADVTSGPALPWSGSPNPDPGNSPAPFTATATPTARRAGNQPSGEDTLSIATTTTTATTGSTPTAALAEPAVGTGTHTGGPASDPTPASAAGQARADRRKGWYLYGWGAHAFPTVVLAVFLGPYLTDLAQNAAGGEKHYLHLLGLSIRAESFYPFAVTAAALLQAAVLPLVGALADRTGRARQLLAAAMALGVAATLAFYTVTGHAYLYGGALFLVANLGYGTANVLANGYLPALATPDERDAISSKGWAIGYLGGAVLLTVALAVYTLHDTLGLSKDHAARVALASAGLWWLVFGTAGLRRLRNPGREERGTGVSRPATDTGYRQVARTLRNLARNRNALLFLLAYVAYNEGVQTVISFASTYGDKELGLGQSVMASAILLVQFVAFGGALWLGRLAGRHGSRSVIAGSLVAWIGVLTAAFFMAKHTAWQFYVLGCAIGIVLGGTQALSRSLFAQIIPAGQEGEYFGLYEISQNGTAWIGSLTIAVAIQITGSYRLAIASLVAFFIIGLILLLRTDLHEAVREAGNPVPERL